jgi:hypothetical protein
MSQSAESPTHARSDQKSLYGRGSFLRKLQEQTGMAGGRHYNALPQKADAIRSPEPGISDAPVQPAAEEDFFYRSDIARERRIKYGGFSELDILAHYVMDYWQYLQEEVESGRAWLPSRGELDDNVPEPDIPSIEQAPTRCLYLPGPNWMADSTPDAKTKYLSLPTYQEWLNS